jgi:hypothetical protein
VNVTPEILGDCHVRCEETTFESNNLFDILFVWKASGNANYSSIVDSRCSLS